MSRRSRAREAALQMLFQIDLNPDVTPDVVREQIQERITDEPLARFAWKLFAGVMECRPELDARIEQLAVNWSLRRMAPTDRNVLRLGAFELLHTNTPPRVVVDEALELAKRFGSAQSSQFVNGILDRLMPHARGESSAVDDRDPTDPEPAA